MSIFCRGKKGLFTHRRRRPKRYENVDQRPIIRTALNTDDALVAQEKATRIEQLQDLMWEAALAGRDKDSMELHDRLRNIAEMRGFAYMPADEIAFLPTTKILDRIEAAVTPTELGATLGAVRAPQITLSALFDEFSRLTEDRQTNKSPEQMRRWQAVRLKAIANLQNVLGDVPIDDIDREAALRFRTWWWDRIKGGKLTANSGNKDITYLSGMLSQVCDLRGIQNLKPFAGLRFQEAENRRASFSRDWISDRMLKPDALSGMNSEARDVLLAIVNTGARPSEIVNLRADCIDLQGNIPTIEIRPDGRELKTRHSQRFVPLVGVSLEAIRRNQDGFPRYADKATHWSNAANKFLRENGLLESPRHAAYSLRHSLNDALINVGCTDRIRKDIMGHRGEAGVIYGAGAALETKLEWLTKIAF